MVSGVSPGASSTGTTREATFPSPGCIRSARPTAWTRSGIEPRRSAQNTESQLAVSTPSPSTFTELRNAFSTTVPSAAIPEANSASTSRRWSGLCSPYSQLAQIVRG